MATWFQQHGLTVLVYDVRTVGESDGEPRSDLDQRKLIEDMHDAVTVSTSLSNIPSQFLRLAISTCNL